MPASLTLLSGLPKYEVFLEEARRCPGLDASACYTYLQLLRTGDELLALDEEVLNSYGTRHGRFNLLLILMKCSSEGATPASLADKTGVTRATISGLLDGLDATTHWTQLDHLRDYGARPTRQRVVEQGKIVTAAGVSAGIDMGLTLAARIAGEDVAKLIQLGVEYDPQPPFDTGSPEKAGDQLVASYRQLVRS